MCARVAVIILVRRSAATPSVAFCGRCAGDDDDAGDDNDEDEESRALSSRSLVCMRAPRRIGDIVRLYEHQFFCRGGVEARRADANFLAALHRALRLYFVFASADSPEKPSISVLKAAADAKA